MTPEDIAIERSVNRDGEAIKMDIETVPTSVPYPQENSHEITESETAETIIETGAENNIKETLKNLEKASGQAEIDTANLAPIKEKSTVEIVDFQETEIVERKKSSKKEKKSTTSLFKLEEETLKDEEDEKIIEVKVPEKIKNFGKSESFE